MSGKPGKLVLSDRWKTALPGILVTAVYILGFAFPESFWGLHYASFLPSGLNYLVMILALALSFWPLVVGNPPALALTSLSRPRKLIVAVLLAAIYGWMFSSFAIASHCYGDAQFVYSNLDGHVIAWDNGMLREIFFPSFSDIKTGIGAYYGLVALIAYFSSLNATIAAAGMDMFLGMTFVLIWLSMTDRFLKNPNARFVFALLGLTAPFLQVYFGHYEVYAVPITLSLAYYYLLLLVFETGSRRIFWVSVVLSYFSMKFHFSNLILIPSLIMAAIRVYGGPRTRMNLLNWKSSLLVFVSPICLLGAVFYLFITKSAFGIRQFTQETIDEVVFLPLRAMESPPLDQYNLLSPAHFFDAFNLLFLLSAGALVLVLVAAWLRPAGIDWKSAATVAVGTTLGLYLVAFFVFNPLMSMPIDWDLMSIPGTALLVFALVLWRKVENGKIFQRLAGPVFGLALLSVAGWWVNSNPAALSDRLEQTGYHSFTTYRIGVSTTFIQALELEADSSKIPIRLQAMLDRLEPEAVPGNDVEYAALQLRMGKWHEKNGKDLPLAVGYYDRAVKYDPMLAEGVYASVIAHFLLGEFETAAKNLPLLVKLRYPDPAKSLRIAIHTSLEAAQYPEAQEYCRRYLKKFPDDNFIRDIHTALQSGEKMGELKFRFRRR